MSSATPLPQAEAAREAELQLRRLLSALLAWHDEPGNNEPLARSQADVHRTVERCSAAGLDSMASGLGMLETLLGTVATDPAEMTPSLLQRLLSLTGELRVQAAELSAPALAMSVSPPATSAVPVPPSIDLPGAAASAPSAGGRPGSTWAQPEASRSLEAFERVAALVADLQEAVSDAGTGLRILLGHGQGAMKPPTANKASSADAASASDDPTTAGNTKPVTVASEPCLLAAVGDRQFAIPLSGVRAVVAWRPTDGPTVTGAGREVTVRFLAPSRAPGDSTRAVVVMGTDTSLTAIATDWLSGWRRLPAGAPLLNQRDDLETGANSITLLDPTLPSVDLTSVDLTSVDLTSVDQNPVDQNSVDQTSVEPTPVDLT